MATNRWRSFDSEFCTFRLFPVIIRNGKRNYQTQWWNAVRKCSLFYITTRRRYTNITEVKLRSESNDIYSHWHEYGHGFQVCVNFKLQKYIGWANSLFAHFLEYAYGDTVRLVM